MKLDPTGVGDVEVDVYQNLKAGQRILLWYSDDTVWHEALVGLVVGGEEAVIYTPDGDLYIERLGCKGAEGPIRLRGLGPRLGYPRGLHGRIYQFRVAPSDDLIRKVIRDSISLAEGERGSISLPASVVKADGTEVSLDLMFGGHFVRRRLGKGNTGNNGAPAGPASATAPLLQNGPLQLVSVAGLAPEHFVWMAAEPLGGFAVGQEVSLNPGTDLQVGDKVALAYRKNDWVKVELVRVEDASEYAGSRCRMFGNAEKDDGELLSRIQAPTAAQAGGKGGGDEEVRTLWVDWDPQGERFKTWRDAVRESFVPNFDEKPLEGPLTALHTMKHMERHGGDARQWLLTWMRTKHIEQTDRVYHELKVLTDALWYAATFDQVNIPALICCEVLCRRIQAVCDAYTNPSKPSWENARVFSGQGGPEDIISPTFRSYATKKNKDELELLQARIKVRELRGAPAASDDAKDPAGPKKPHKGGRKGGGRGDGA